MAVLVALIAGLLLFGTKRLPEMGASLGHGIRQFKKSLQEIGDTADLESPVARPSAPDVRRSIAAPTIPDERGVT